MTLAFSSDFSPKNFSGVCIFVDSNVGSTKHDKVALFFLIGYVMENRSETSFTSMAIASETTVDKTISPVSFHKMKLGFIKFITAHSFRELGIIWMKSLFFKEYVKLNAKYSGTHCTRKRCLYQIVNTKRGMSFLGTLFTLNCFTLHFFELGRNSGYFNFIFKILQKLEKLLITKSEKYLILIFYQKFSNFIFN